MYDLTKDATNAIPFVMVDSSGVEVTGLGGVFTVTLSKNGAGFGASAGTKAELASGWYLYTATAGECDTLGPLALKITGAGCAQQNLVYQVAVKQTGDAYAVVANATYGNSALHTDIAALGGGAGAITYTFTVDDGVLPIDGVEVWASTDIGGTNVVAGTKTTDALGQVVFMLDAGTYYAWIQRAGYNFTNPTAFTVS
jgi:hypothetical protein